jgi:L-fucose isomerase
VALLQALNPAVPPLFGDFKYAKGGTIYISNCGGSSVYYAANSMDAAKVLPELRFEGQCQGAMGSAVGYWGKATMLTILRLYRIAGRYRVQVALGRGLDITENPTSWGAMWPTIGIALGVDDEKLIRVAAGNHFAATDGDVVEEAEHLFRFTGIPVERIDSNEALDAAYAARTTT